MKYINSIKTSLLIILICFCTFCSGYTMGSSFVFADSTTDNWTQVTTNQQLVEAFKYYCKSRDLTIDGSVSDAVTSFTTKTFNGLCNTLGIDVTALQAHLKYETDGNQGLRFLFDSTGITAYNAIFAQFLQDNNLEVGDTNINETLYSGRYFKDDDGIGCFVFIYHHTDSSYGVSYANKSNILFGTPYGLTNNDVNSRVSSANYSYNYHVNNQTYSFVMWGNYIPYGEIYMWKTQTQNANWKVSEFYSTTAKFACEGYPCIMYNSQTDKLYIGIFNDQIKWSQYVLTAAYEINNTSQNCNITINATVINNNNYEGDTIINNYGTPSDPNNPTPDPDPDTPELPAPDTQPATDWDIELPDLTVPNWILSGKENKFPFDIPFNVMYALSLLQAEPQAPELEGTLDFGFYEWEYDLDLSDFDTVAEICRDMEFLAFLTGLMLMTRKLIWG